LWFDEIIEIKRENVTKIFETSRKLARNEGLLVGMSSGAVMWVALKKAEQLGKGKTIVVLLPDTGEMYLSAELFGNGGENDG
jgi:cysteine synthase